jgi:hypothetical protein
LWLATLLNRKADAKLSAETESRPLTANMPAFQCQICYLKCHNQELLGKHCYEKHWNQAARVAALLEKQVTNSNITTQASASISTDPSLQIMTKDGQRLAAYKPKAPKTDKQKAETQLMRVLKACDECRRRKSKVSLSGHSHLII